MPTLKIQVEALGGEADERAIERTLRAHDGVFGVAVDAGARCIEVDYADDVVGVRELLDALRRAGYDARVGG